MRIVPPYKGEFGLKICYHVPAVHALTGEYAVAIEPGEEALYPGAARHITVERGDDDDRAGGKHWRLGDTWALRNGYTEIVRLTPESPKQRFVPEPLERVGLVPDVVICPRLRRYGAQKNWPGWARLAEDLQSDGLSVFAAGAPDTSYPVPCPAAWEHPRFLDASIEAMLAARVVIATDAGLAHLAVLCGRPLVLIAYGGGLVAPGPVIDSGNRVAFDRYWPIRMQEYYHGPNHRNAPILMVPHGWEQPETVLQATLQMTQGRTTV